MQASQTLLKQTFGHYQIVREAGRGGMSVVYEAIDARFGRRVALKVLAIPQSLSPEMRSAMITRLNREARAIARLSHPNIVTIYDIGEEDGQHFIVMEYLEGLTLRERLDQGPLTSEEALSVLDQVAGGLDAVHAAGIVHRDIKPSNVMLLPNGTVKLMDFGVARQNEDTLVTQAGTMVGSPVYMAPEQINGEQCQAASDLWSLGIVLYEMLAGKTPFAGGNIPNVLYQVTHRDPPPLPRATPAVQRVLLRALDKDPAGRYGSAQELVAAFRTALQPARAAAPPLPRALAYAAPALARPPKRPRVRLARPAPIPRPILWASGLLFIVLMAALPQALHPRRLATQPVPIAAPPAALRLPAVKPSIKRPIAAAHVTPHTQAAPAPVVGVAAVRQERTFHRARPASHHSVRAMRERFSRPPARFFVSPRTASAPKAPWRPSRRPFPTRRWRDRAPAVTTRPPTRPAAPDFEAVGAASSAPASPETHSSETHSSVGPNLLGTWHGRHSHNPATLIITHREGDTFGGTMSVRTHEANVHIAVTGHVSKTGAVSMHETRVLSASQPRAWDLGSESGRIAGKGRIEGKGTDVKGRQGDWSFSR